MLCFNKKFCLIFVLALLTGSSAFTKPCWNIVFKTDAVSDTHCGVEFHKNDRKKFNTVFENPHRIGFMVPLDNCQTNHRRFVFKGIYRHEEQSFNYLDYLVDIKGNGDKRYLIVANWSGGNSGIYDDGYLIDTKDDFAVIGRIPVGECFDYPMPNTELVFTYYDTIAYFSTRAEVGIRVKKKLQKGKAAEVLYEIQKEISLTPYKKILENKNWLDSREFAFGSLYCDLAGAGLLKKLPQYAQKLGFTEKEIADKSLFYLKKIRQSRFYKHIRRLNRINL